MYVCHEEPPAGLQQRVEYFEKLKADARDTERGPSKGRRKDVVSVDQLAAVQDHPSSGDAGWDSFVVVCFYVSHVFSSFSLFVVRSYFCVVVMFVCPVLFLGDLLCP